MFAERSTYESFFHFSSVLRMYTSRCIKCSIHCALFCRRQSPRKSSTIARTMVDATHWQMHFHSNRPFLFGMKAFIEASFCWWERFVLAPLNIQTIEFEWFDDCFNVRLSIEMYIPRLVNKKQWRLCWMCECIAEWVDVWSHKWRIWHFTQCEWTSSDRTAPINGINKLVRLCPCESLPYDFHLHRINCPWKNYLFLPSEFSAEQVTIKINWPS